MGIFSKAPAPSIAEATTAATAASRKRLEAKSKTKSKAESRPASKPHSDASSYDSRTSIASLASSADSTPMSAIDFLSESPRPRQPSKSMYCPTQVSTSSRPRLSRAATSLTISIVGSPSDNLPVIPPIGSVAAGPGAKVPQPARQAALALPPDGKKRLPSVSGLCMNPPTPDNETPKATLPQMQGLTLQAGPRPQRPRKASDEWQEYKDKRRSGWVGV